MKTACIVSKNPLIYDERVKKELNTLIKLGFYVYVICTKDFNQKKYHKSLLPLKTHEIKKGYEIFRLSNINELQFNLKSFQLINKISPSLLWCIDGNTMLSGFLSKIKNKDLFSVVDFHEIFYERDFNKGRPIKKFFEKISEKFFSSYFDQFLSVSPFSSKILIKDLRLKSRPITIHNSPLINNSTENRESMRRKFNIPENRKIILYAGIIFPGRGLEFLLDALKTLNEYYLYLVGPDRYFGRFDTLVNTRGLNDRVVRFPLMEHSEMMDFIKIGNIGYIGTEPGCKNHEYTLANKLYEYTMSGLPIIASNVSAYKNTVDRYSIGKTFKFPSIKSFKESIKIIEKNSVIFSNNAKRFSTANSWEKQQSKIKKILKPVKKISGRNKIYFSKEKLHINLKQPLLIRSAPDKVICSFIGNNTDLKKLYLMLQPSTNIDFLNKTDIEISNILSFPEDGMFKLSSINSKFMKKILSLNTTNAILTSFTEDFSDKWRLFLLFKILGFKVFLYGSDEKIKIASVLDFIPGLNIYKGIF